MEILHFNLIQFLLFLLILLIFVGNWKNLITRSEKRLPPGPWTFPFIGSMHHLIGALPHHALRNLSRKYGPLMHLQLGEIHAVVVSSPHMAEQVLKVHDLSFAGRPKLIGSDIVFYNQKDIAFAKYGDYWKRMRKICMSDLLNAKMVKSFSLIRQDEVHDLVTSIRSKPNDVVNMTEKALQLTSSVICKSAFGKVWDYRDNLLMLMREVLFFLGGFDVADFFPSWMLLREISGTRRRLMSMHRKLDVILENIINVHKQNKANGKKGNGVFGGEDLIDVLLRVMENDELQFPITNDNIKAVILVGLDPTHKICYFHLNVGQMIIVKLQRCRTSSLGERKQHLHRQQRSGSNKSKKKTHERQHSWDGKVAEEFVSRHLPMRLAKQNHMAISIGSTRSSKSIKK